MFANGAGNLTIQTAAYKGTAAIASGATYVWKKYTSGAWTTISGQTGSSLSVAGSTVDGMASFQCTMTYDGETYTDTISLTDKTDNYQAAIESSGGDVFKNVIGSSTLLCRLFQNGVQRRKRRNTAQMATSVIWASFSPGSIVTIFTTRTIPSPSRESMLTYDTIFPRWRVVVGASPESWKTSKQLLMFLSGLITVLLLLNLTIAFFILPSLSPSRCFISFNCAFGHSRCRPTFPCAPKRL